MSSFSKVQLSYEGVGNKEDLKIGKEINKQNNLIKDDEILNTATGRYVLKTGKIGKKILEDLENSNKIIYKQHLPPNNLPYTNWITYPNFLVGTYPRNEDVDKIKKLDINIFISLLKNKKSQFIRI